jgi:hypothetical protein
MNAEIGLKLRHQIDSTLLQLNANSTAHKSSAASRTINCGEHSGTGAVISLSYLRRTSKQIPLLSLSLFHSVISFFYCAHARTVAETNLWHLRRERQFAPINSHLRQNTSCRLQHSTIIIRAPESKLTCQWSSGNFKLAPSVGVCSCESLSRARRICNPPLSLSHERETAVPFCMHRNGRLRGPIN